MTWSQHSSCSDSTHLNLDVCISFVTLDSREADLYLHLALDSSRSNIYIYMYIFYIYIYIIFM